MSEYLAIKNWTKFQPLRGKGRYIFDYTNQDDEPELAKLSMFQRGVYQELRRIRGRRGRNIPNDMEFILSAMSAPLKDRPRIPCAIRVLTACGLLALTNQEVDVLQAGDIERENDKDKEKKPSARKARGPISKASQVAVATGESRHVRIQGMVMAAWSEHNAEKGCPWGPADAKQLQLLLGKCPAKDWPDSSFAQCLMHMYGTEGFPRSQLPMQFLPRLPSYFSKAKDRFDREIGSNGTGTSKAERRNADISETTRSVFDPSRHVLGDAAKSLPDKTPT